MVTRFNSFKDVYVIWSSLLTNCTSFLRFVSSFTLFTLTGNLSLKLPESYRTFENVLYIIEGDNGNQIYEQIHPTMRDCSDTLLVNFPALEHLI